MMGPPLSELLDLDFRGILIADHVPRMAANSRTRRAYGIGYIQAMHDMARTQHRRI